MDRVAVYREGSTGEAVACPFDDVSLASASAVAAFGAAIGPDPIREPVRRPHAEALERYFRFTAMPLWARLALSGRHGCDACICCATPARYCALASRGRLRRSIAVEHRRLRLRGAMRRAPLSLDAACHGCSGDTGLQHRDPEPQRDRPAQGDRLA